MQKILFVISQLYKGGAETSLVNLLNGLDYKKYSVELLILDQRPVPNAISLIERVNNKVTICDAYAEYQKITLIDRIRAKMLYTYEQKGAYYFTALDFVHGKEYDWAFFVGEWCSPSFVAYEVNARLKAAWIHSDISKADYFDADHYYYFFDMFDYFIFVSKHSLESSVKAYPFIKDKAVTIYNINDVPFIKKCADESVDDLDRIKRPILLTCANFRTEKNHFRQVQVMVELKRRGYDFSWVNIGSTSNEKLVGQVKALCRQHDLENQFIILGPKENPYKYIRNVDAVTVLSDHESWSMVITEAKILGKTVIATKTSGALEQIEHKKTGILTEFDAISIADTIEEFINTPDLKKRIEDNIANFDNTQEILDDFDQLITTGVKCEKKRDILYVIDDINYMSGAQKATLLQIKELVKSGRAVTIYSSSVPSLKVRKELNGVHFLSLKSFDENRVFDRRLIECLLDNSLDHETKKRKIRYTLDGYKKVLNYDKQILPHISKLFSKYPVICVMSEASAYRNAVADSSCANKIQWIHTDYVHWKKTNEWTEKITANDGEIYKNYTSIVVLTKEMKNEFISVYPDLADKVIVNQNLIPAEEIKEKAKAIQVKNIIPVNFITVGRFGYEKQFSQLIEILADIKNDGYRFNWTIVGGGELFEHINELVRHLNLEKEVHLLGMLDNPFREMKKADVFALLSSYEGVPNTIYESMILGVPVLATNVGGISSQVEDGKYGWLVPNNKEKIKEKIIYLLMNQNEIEKAKKYLEEYTYNNCEVLETIQQIFINPLLENSKNC